MPVDVPIKGRGQSRPSRFTRPRRSTSKLGFIKGGVCDGIHQSRRKREKGALEVVYLILHQKRCFEEEGNKFRILNYPKFDGMKYGRLWGGDFEIGMYRYTQHVIPLLIEQAMLVTKEFLKKLARQIASFEFGVSAENPLSILEGKASFGLCPPHADDIYRKRFKDKVVKP